MSKMGVLEAALQEMNEAFLMAKTPHGVREADRSLNDANRAVILAMQQTYGEVYLLSVNGNKGMRKLEVSENLTNYCCEFCLPSYDKELLKLADEWKQSGKLRTLKELYNRANALGAIPFIWA